MTNYSDIPMSSFVCQDVKQYTFNDDKPKWNDKRKQIELFWSMSICRNFDGIL